MRVKSAFLWLAALALLLIPFVAQAQGNQSECTISYLFDAWARSTPDGAPNGAIFGILVNLGSEADMLVSASTDAAEVVEFHETTMGENDVMQMHPVEGGFVIEPHNYLELAPGGLPIMLINLNQPLEASSTFDLALNFENAGEVVVTVPIVEMTDMEAGAEMSVSMPTQDMTPSAMSPSITKWDVACAKMHVVGAWARPAAAGMPNSAAYALLLNLTDTDDTLISVSADAAEVVELHEMRMGDGDVMQMRPVEGGIPVPAGGTAHLRPGGLHVMLIGLKQEMEAGAALNLTLTFAESGDIELTVPVHEPLEAGTPMAGM